MNSSKKGQFAPQRIKKPPPELIQSNGTANVPLSYPVEPPDDENMNEIVSEQVELEVVLPDEKIKYVTIDTNTPMIDLLVNLSASSKLNPGGHAILVLSEETGKPRDYKPNQTIGSLCDPQQNPKRLTVYLRSKKLDKKTSSGSIKPFETTYRFTINLPHNQKKVLRISPASSLAQVHQQICSEKRLDPSRYRFQLIADPQQEIDMQRTVGELGTNEINLINTMTMESAKSMPELSVGRSHSVRNTDISTAYMPTAGEGKKKKGFFSFLKKDKKFNVQSASANHDRSPSSSRSVGGSPPVMRRKSDQQMTSGRPQTMYVEPTKETLDTRPKSMMINRIPENVVIETNNSSSLQTVPENVQEKVPPARTKKRRAPPPPQKQTDNAPMKTIQVEISVEKQNIEKQAAHSSPRTESGSEKPKIEQLAQKLHSRNSSDSSGYHELTLSGAESPEAGRIDECIENDFKIRVDSTSIDSGEHMNGESAVRNVSPPDQQKFSVQNMEVGASQTLPLNKSSKKDPVRSRSLERKDEKSKGPVKKKKAAPPPPPGKTPPKPHQMPKSSAPPTHSQPSVTEVVAPVKAEVVASSQPVSQEESDALAIDEVLDDLDIGLDGSMLMVESASLASEDIDIDLMEKPRNPRPCSFVAPPPPVEPPPPDLQPVDYNILIGQKVDTVDVGVETSDDSASEEPQSLKSSPVSTHSRPESRTSISSVNTIEDISMAFQLTIAAAEEAMLESDDEENKRKAGADQPTIESTIELALQEEEEEPADERIPSQPSSTKSSPREAINESNTEDYEVSEITYNFTVENVPAGFQTENKEVSDTSKLPDNLPKEEEEEQTTFEIPKHIQPSVPHEIVSSEEKNVTEQSSNEEHAEPEEKVEIVQQVSPPPVVEQKPKEPPKPKEKEVFVFKLDDLQVVNFSGPKKKKKPEPIPEPVPDLEPEPESEVPVSPTVKEIKSRFEIEEEGFSSPVIEWSSIGQPDEVTKETKDNVKDRCSELSFSPNTEGEQEHVLEEKSISMIALPATRSNPEKKPLALENLFKEDDNIVSEDVIVTSEVKNVHSSPEVGDNANASNQSAELQQQFAMWQAQLQQNQNLLSSSENMAGGGDDAAQLQKQLKEQLEMQKKMMEQMQQSMAALAVKQQTPSEPLQQAPVKTSENTQIVPPPPPAPPQLQNGSVHKGVTPGSMEEKKAAPAVFTKPKKSRRVIEPPKLDPREELMIAIRNKGGMASLNKVSVNQTKWHKALS